MCLCEAKRLSFVVITLLNVNSMFRNVDYFKVIKFLAFKNDLKMSLKSKKKCLGTH